MYQRPMVGINDEVPSIEVRVEDPDSFNHTESFQVNGRISGFSSS